MLPCCPAACCRISKSVIPSNPASAFCCTLTSDGPSLYAPADPRQQKQKKRKASKQELLAQAQEKQEAATELGATQEGKVGG